MKRHHEPPVLFYFSGFPGSLAWFSFQMFCLNNKIHFPLANANNSASLKKNWLKVTGFAHSQTTNKLVNKAGNDSARVSGQDSKKPPAPWTSQIAGFGGFRPFASLEKIIHQFYYSFKIFRRFWLAQIVRLILYSQSALAKFGRCEQCRRCLCWFL